MSAFFGKYYDSRCSNPFVVIVSGQSMFLMSVHPKISDFCESSYSKADKINKTDDCIVGKDKKK